MYIQHNAKCIYMAATSKIRIFAFPKSFTVLSSKLIHK